MGTHCVGMNGRRVFIGAFPITILAYQKSTKKHKIRGLKYMGIVYSVSLCGGEMSGEMRLCACTQGWVGLRLRDRKSVV